MHELSIICGVTQALRESAEARRVTRIRRVRLRVGRWSGVWPSSLRFCFQLLTADDPLLRDAALEIEESDDAELLLDSYEAEAGGGAGDAGTPRDQNGPQDAGGQR
ncbi:MAG: hydrogenase maturation nickel metallochaperone HypA [Firmicutes bacterium]|nr:hydrogenase maturation nickel metallochaperone HypA [Bacillota bacterium]